MRHTEVVCSLAVALRDPEKVATMWASVPTFLMTFPKQGEHAFVRRVGGSEEWGGFSPRKSWTQR